MYPVPPCPRPLCAVVQSRLARRPHFRRRLTAAVAAVPWTEEPTPHAMASESAGPAELGFVEAAPSWRLRSEQFPSKVGGRPAWLSAAGLPGPPELACPLCGRPMAFLLQVYAPLPGRADAFHRCLFLFCCRTPPCCCGLRGERLRPLLRVGSRKPPGLPRTPLASPTRHPAGFSPQETARAPPYPAGLSPPEPPSTCRGRGVPRARPLLAASLLVS